MQRRSFFSSLFATAAVTAVAVEAKPAPVAKGTLEVTSYASWMCSYCRYAMWAEYNHTMRCKNQRCPNYDIPLREPRVRAEVALSDEHEVIRHAMIILGKLKPGRNASPSELELGEEVLRRYLREANKACAEPLTARDVRPEWFADELKPYYNVGPRI